MAYVTLTFDHDLATSDIDHLRESTGAMWALELPPIVRFALHRAQRWRFDYSSRIEVGMLLSALATAAPLEGRVLEIGTGAGVGLAWIVHGVGERSDLEIVSVERDPDLARRVRECSWPSWVSIITGDGAEILVARGSFDLIFADTPDEKALGIGLAVAALRPGGILILDDMEKLRGAQPDQSARLARVRRELSENPLITVADLPLATGVVLAVRRRIW